MKPAARGPTVAQVLQLALSHQKAGRPADAAALYARVLETIPDHPDALHLLGLARCRIGEVDEGIADIRRAIERAPTRALFHYNLGRVLDEADQLEEAAAAYLRALELRPALAEAHANLADLRRRQGRVAESLAAFHTSFLLRRRDQAPDAKLDTYRVTTRAKLVHDVQQMEHLASRGLLPEAHRDAPAVYRELLAELGGDASSEPVELTPEQIERLAPTYNRVVHLDPGARIPGPAIHPGLDGVAITRSYVDRAPGITHIDGLLTAEALVALRRYCLDSTFWFDCGYRGGYLGAYVEDGFDCPLLLQIAEELTALLPDLLEGKPLRQLWAYKYDSTLTGIGVHADSSAVNVNFWLTPDDANLDPERGGLVVTTAEAPLDWDHGAYNKTTSEAKIREFIAAAEGEEVRVPHRQNRAVLFNSDLFHWTDAFRFREGYENRRLNVTMLFGDRLA